MAIAAERSGRETLATTFILDGDVHLNEPPGELAEYAEAPWDIGLREIAKSNGLYLALPGMAPRAEYRVPWPGGQNRSQVVTTAADMRRELDELHVGIAAALLAQGAAGDPRRQRRALLRNRDPGEVRAGSTSGTLVDGDVTGWKLTWSHEGEIVTCPWHGLEFHVPTGQCMAWPEIRLRTYEVAVVDGEIEVAL